MCAAFIFPIDTLRLCAGHFIEDVYFPDCEVPATQHEILLGANQGSYSFLQTRYYCLSLRLMSYVDTLVTGTFKRLLMQGR